MRKNDAHATQVENLFDGPPEVLVPVLRNAHQGGEIYVTGGVSIQIHLGQDRRQPLTREGRMLHVDEAPVLIGDRRFSRFERRDDRVEATHLLRVSLFGDGPRGQDKCTNGKRRSMS